MVLCLVVLHQLLLLKLMASAKILDPLVFHGFSPCVLFHFGSAVVAIVETIVAPDTHLGCEVFVSGAAFRAVVLREALHAFLRWAFTSGASA